jgi:hypothetical protein
MVAKHLAHLRKIIVDTVSDGTAHDNHDALLRVVFLHGFLGFI